MSLDKEILELAENYFFGDRSQYNALPRVAKLLFDAYFQDKNSSTLREALTLSHNGYEKVDKKQGPDGYHKIRKKFAEVKPQYAHIDEKNKQTKFSGGGTFNDMTFEKIKEIEDYDMLCSGFAQDKIIFIVRFPTKFIASYLHSNLTKIIDKPKRRKSIKFGYNAYINCPDLEILFFDEQNAKQFMSKDMYKMFCKK